MTLTRIKDATVEPVSVTEAKLHLSETLVDVANDAYIQSLITTARQAAEAELQRTLLRATWRLSLRAFEAELELPRPPLVSVSSIQYYDPTGALCTLDPSAYIVDADSARLVPALNTSWPATATRPGAVIVEYIAGYGQTPGSVPAPVRHWIKLALTDLYQRRALSGETPAVAHDFTEALLDAGGRIWSI